MEINNLLKNAEKLHLHLIQNLNNLRTDQGDCILLSEQSLMCIDDIIRKLKKQVASYDFSSLAEEVYFFKNIKPKFISEYLFHKQLLELETSKPQSTKKDVKKFYQVQMQKLRHIYDENREFYNYYKRQATYLDHKYFVRQSFDLKMKLPHQLYNYDEAFATSHDDDISMFMANERLLKYIQQELHTLESQHLTKPNVAKNLQWTSSKAALVELIYALYHNHSFNSGAVELKEIIKTFEKLLAMDLSSFHKSLTEIKSRKTNPTKFLNQLSENLNQYFQNDNL